MSYTSKFSQLSIRDLIEARDQFHVHLMNKKNVIATAIGRYLIRLTDLDENGRYIAVDSKDHTQKTKRTLNNSVVIDISWPCVLVFVETWQDEEDLVKEGGENIVPKTIYMPDGRTVPLCIVEASRSPTKANDIDLTRLRFPENLIGGGFPLLMHSQGVDWVATVGCLVADGHGYYALTNKHVTGEGGEIVYSRFGANRRRVGIASGKTLGKVDFSKLYSGWKSENLRVNCDVGLVEVDDLTRWKTDVVALGSIGPLYDLNIYTLDLGLIAEHTINDGVRTSSTGQTVASGAVSGRMEGEILALCYRYGSVGGREYVSDFLIGGRSVKPLAVGHGDSGALWMLETKDETGRLILRPLALHWGQHSFIQGKQKSTSNFSLATCLSNVCRELDVEVIRDWNVDLDYSWGKVGHYTIGTLAMSGIDAIVGDDRGFAGFNQFMKANVANISFPKSGVGADLDAKDNPLLSKDPTAGFCPLADVPDIIWKQSKTTTTWGRQGDENPNHYADADAPTVRGGNLFDICDAPEKLTTEVWKNFYANIDVDKIGLHGRPVSQGLICFRVWQIFNYMVKALKQHDQNRFIFGAGVLAHYVGDGCQPLHSSYMSDGDPADDQTVNYTAKRDSPASAKSPHKKGDVYQKINNPGTGVHVAYEDSMIDDKIDLIFPKVNEILSSALDALHHEEIPAITSGQTAGYAVLQLMRRTQADISPHDIVVAYKKAKGNSNVSDALYDAFGDATAKCMARGCLCLASIWKAAWTMGNGAVNLNQTAITRTVLQNLYADRGELPSQHLDTIDTVLL